MSRIKSIGTLLVVLVLVLLLLLLIVIPALASLLVQPGANPTWQSNLLNFSDRFTQRFMLVFVVVWIFFLGSTFASFLNVVAWRVPRGKSILGSSHCPHCEVKLSFFRDNIPIIGWIKNKGKCSSCQNPISARYLVVEIVLGVIFLGIAAMVITTGGATIPFYKVAASSYWYSLIFHPKMELIQLVIFHWMLMLSLYTFALIELEQLKIPISIWIVGAIAGLVSLLIWPFVQVVDWQFPFELFAANGITNVLSYITCGMAAGALFGWMVDQVKFVEDQPNSLVIGNSIVGLYLGWQSALAVALISSITMMIATRPTPANPTIKNMLHSPHANLLMATLIHLATWRWLQLL